MEGEGRPRRARGAVAPGGVRGGAGGRPRYEVRASKTSSWVAVLALGVVVVGELDVDPVDGGLAVGPVRSLSVTPVPQDGRQVRERPVVERDRAARREAGAARRPPAARRGSCRG